jgi:integrase
MVPRICDIWFVLAALKRERFGEEAPPADVLLFPGQGGKPQDPAALRRGAWARARRRAGLPRSHPHVLRHTYVSMFSEQGEDLAYIAPQVGHSSVVVTATSYAKLLKPRRRHVAAAVEARLRDNGVITSAPEPADTARHAVALSVREVGQTDTVRNGTTRIERAKYFKAE